jgi:hypothetical protein
LNRHRIPEELGKFCWQSRLAEKPGALPNIRLVRMRHAQIASVFALYPSTTTEIPFT